LRGRPTNTRHRITLYSKSIGGKLEAISWQILAAVHIRLPSVPVTATALPLGCLLPFSAISRLTWLAPGGRTIVNGDAGIPESELKAGEIMQSAVAEPTSSAGTLDEQLATRLLYQRIIVLGTEVDDRVANRLCAQLLLLSAEDPRSDISLYINSPGGSVSAGLAIYDTMRLIPNDVSTLAMGLAGSMGQFLLCAGTAGKRFSLPHAQVLMHQGSAGFGGTAADVEIYAEQLERTGATMIRLISEHTGQPVDRVEKDSLRDRWFSAGEARDYGIIDHIVERLDDVRPASASRKAGL
jgi:ATP-dependent Clp protease protease subunit